MLDSSTELVPVYVPRALLAEVYAFIANHGQAEAATERTEERQSWTKDLLTEAFLDLSENMRAILSKLAENPGEWLTAADLASAMPSPNGRDAADWNNVAGTLGAFERRVKGRYQKNGKPFDVRWGGGRYRYRMDPDIAEVIREVERNLNEVIEGAKKGTQ